MNAACEERAAIFYCDDISAAPQPCGIKARAKAAVKLIYLRRRKILSADPISARLLFAQK